MNITCLTIDCTEPIALANFWNEALVWGGVIVNGAGDSAICRPPSEGMYINFVRLPEGEISKNRINMEFSVESFDGLDDEIARLMFLGAYIEREDQFKPEVAKRYRKVVLKDIEGNEFSISARKRR